MSDTDSIALATRRLTLALDALEAAAERRSEADRGEQSLASQVHTLGGDRARLASELDDATARARALGAMPPAGMRGAWARVALAAARRSGFVIGLAGTCYGTGFANRGANANCRGHGIACKAP